jgi:hypothetical protein
MYNHRCFLCFPQSINLVRDGDEERRLSVDLIAQFRERHFPHAVAPYLSEEEHAMAKQHETEAQQPSDAHLTTSPMYITLADPRD